MKYVDQSASELSLNLFTSHFDKKILNIISTKNFKFNQFNIEIGIIGASHFIEIKENDLVVFCEVFACLAIPEAIETFKFFKNKSTLKRDAFSYRFEVDKREITDSIDRIAYFQENNSLEFDFGNTNDAITSLVFNIKSDKITFETLHVYPNEGLAIFTESLFNLGGKNHE